MKIDNDFFTFENGQEEKTIWVSWDYLKENVSHIQFNRCYLGLKEIEQAKQAGFNDFEIKEAERNIKDKEQALLTKGWGKKCSMHIGVINGKAFCVDGNNRLTALYRINKNKTIIEYIRVEVAKYDSMEEMFEAFNEMNDHIVKQSSVQKIGRSSRMNGGSELDGYSMICNVMDLTGATFTTVEHIMNGYSSAHKSRPTVSSENFRFTSKEVSEAWAKVVCAFKNDKERHYIYSKIKGISFAYAFTSLILNMVRFTNCKVQNGEITEEEQVKLLSEAYMDMSKCLIEKFSRSRSKQSFQDKIGNKSDTMSAFIRQACEEYDKSENEVFNYVFGHYKAAQ